MGVIVSTLAALGVTLDQTQSPFTAFSIALASPAMNEDVVKFNPSEQLTVWRGG
jgi:hypothetical protein